MGLRNCYLGFSKFWKNESIWQHISRKNMFLKIFPKMLYFSKKKNAENMSKNFFMRVPVAISAWYLRKCLSYPLIHFSVYKLHYTTTIPMHVLACFKSRTRKQMVSSDLRAQTASDRHLFIDFGDILNLTLFYLTLTWPSV